MCGRYVASTPPDQLADLFGVTDVLAGDLGARWNVAPTLDVYAVATGSDGTRRLGTFRWGLVPWFAKDPSGGAKMINARAETVAEKPAFRSAFRHRRCLIPADCFFEWEQRRGRGAKQAYAICRRDRQPFAFAGVWEEWRPKGEDAAGEEVLRTCALITTEANAVIAPFHHRMPVILAPEEYDRWLDPETPLGELEALLRPAPEDWLEAYPVSRHVNDPRADDPRVLEPAGGDLLE